MLFSKLVDAMMDDVRHSELGGGFDVEVKVSYREDAEGVLHAFVEGQPTVKFSVVKRGKDVVMQPYYFSEGEEEEVGN